MGKETEGRGSTVKLGETLLEGRIVCVFVGVGVCENPVRFSLNDGPVETVEYMWVNIWCMLDGIIGFWSQDCRNTLPWHKLLNF